MFGKSAHPDDAALFALEACDPDVQAHVESCAACRDRADRLAAFRLDAAEAGSREVDALFSQARWTRQRTQILARLAHLGQPARVIPFPGRRVVAPGFWARYGWMAGSAAAGLVLGVLGSAFFVIDRDWAASPVPTVVATPVAAPADDLASSSRLEDEMFLLELNDALGAWGCEELRALDDLTPRALQQPSVFEP